MLLGLVVSLRAVIKAGALICWLQHMPFMNSTSMLAGIVSLLILDLKHILAR